MPFIIYADTELVLEKISSYEKKSLKSTTKITQHTPCGYFLFTYCSFDCNKNKHSFYRDADCMKKFCVDLRNHATKIVNCEEKELIPSTKKNNNKRNRKSKSVTISAKKNSMKMTNKVKLEITVFTQENLEMPLIICVISDVKH